MTEQCKHPKVCEWLSGPMEACSLVASAKFQGFIDTFHIYFPSGNEYIHAKQLIDKEKIKASETKKRLRDLSVIMGIKKDLLKELVKTGGSVCLHVVLCFCLCLLIHQSIFPPLSNREGPQSLVGTQFVH